MKKEYIIAKEWKILIWICFPLFMILSGCLGIIPYTEDKINLILALILTPISLGLEFLMILGFIYIRKHKLIIEKDQIINVGIFKTKKLNFNNVKGFKVDKNYLSFFPKNKRDKKIKVSTYISRFGELLLWSEQQFNNLDLEEYVNEEKEILKNKKFGETQEKRKYNLAKTKKTTKILNNISWIVALSTWFYPHFYQIQIILCAILPIIGLIIYKTSKGLIRLDVKSNSPYPIIHSTLMIPSLALLIRALVDFKILDYSSLWSPILTIIAVFGVLMLMDPNIQYDFKKGHTYLTVLGTLLISGAYAYGLLITTNAAFDKSEPITYDTEILNKRISSGKSTTYYLKLDKWGPQNKIDEISVAKDIYINKKIGDKAVVYFNNGLYKIPYYFVIK